MLKWIRQAGLMLMLSLGLGFGANLWAAGSTAEPATPTNADASFDFFSDKPVESQDVVVIPPEQSHWITVGGPIALLLFGGLILWITKLLIPFDKHSVDINLRNFPPAAKRGMAIAVVLFGIAFAFGASEIWYQMQFFGSSAEFIKAMSLGKLIVMTHAHLFGFTTAFFIVGIPFSMQFNHIRLYQWIFPIGLTASLIDVMSWWGIKYIANSFEMVSMVCALLFSGSYLWMLIGLLRTLAFPEVIWASDKDRALRAEELKRKKAAKREFRKFFN
ncbi:MAG TPA: hypothetical protein VGE55_14575 [Limnobacter sp.]|uniref:hypothetical protein n=1 Tax=Limnobacter sp. TaxID=2003368 RepID=UPI002EDB84AF